MLTPHAPAKLNILRLSLIGIAASLSVSFLSVPADSQPQPAASPLTYADLADLGLSAPVVAHVRLSKLVRLKGADAANVGPGKTRFYMEADIVSLVRGPSGMPAQVSYLVDLPNDLRGRPPKPAKKSEYLLFASRGNGGELRLSAPDAQIPFNPQQADRVREILREASGNSPPPRISGIGRAFHVPGSLPGESETQIFLQAADGRPISLTVLRRPGEQGQWAVALSEIVDDAARPPARDTLLWYRLACTLPQSLPAQSFTGSAPTEVRAIQADYRLVLDGLGPCERRRPRS
jgi:hypothetical protein